MRAYPTQRFEQARRERRPDRIGVAQQMILVSNAELPELTMQCFCTVVRVKGVAASRVGAERQICIADLGRVRPGARARVIGSKQSGVPSWTEQRGRKLLIGAATVIAELLSSD